MRATMQQRRHAAASRRQGRRARCGQGAARCRRRSRHRQQGPQHAGRACDRCRHPRICLPPPRRRPRRSAKPGRAFNSTTAVLTSAPPGLTQPLKLRFHDRRNFTAEGELERRFQKLRGHLHQGRAHADDRIAGWTDLPGNFRHDVHRKGQRRRRGQSFRLEDRRGGNFLRQAMIHGRRHGLLL